MTWYFIVNICNETKVKEKYFLYYLSATCEPSDFWKPTENLALYFALPITNDEWKLDRIQLFKRKRKFFGHR